MHHLWTQHIFLFSVPLKYNTAQPVLVCLLNTVTHRKQAPFSVNAEDFFRSTDTALANGLQQTSDNKNVGLASRMPHKSHITCFSLSHYL